MTFNSGNRDLTRIFKTLFFICILGTAVALPVIGGVIYYFSSGLPEIITIEDYRPLTVSRIYGGGGKEAELLGEFYKERRYIIPYEKIPQSVVKAFIAAEDDRFFEHPGINIASIIRAGIANYRAGHVVQGGSTITQQVVKSLLLTSEKSFDRKIKEVILASRLERNLSKEQILYLYLNQIYLGHGAYGVQAASKTYFNKDVSEINLAEAALLAGMPQAPGKFSPHLNPKRAKERQLYVLRRMLENRFITPSEMDLATAASLRIYGDRDINKEFAPYYVEHLRRFLVEKYGEKSVYEEGLTVTVPLTKEHALSAKRSLVQGLRETDKRQGYRGPIEHLKSEEEIENFLKQSRHKMIVKRLKFQLFTPEGTLDTQAALEDGGIESEKDLIDTEEPVPAVVMGFDKKKKSARVIAGAIRGELPLALMKWARPVRNESSPNADRPYPSDPARVFKKGDVILVRMVKASGDSDDKASPALSPSKIASPERLDDLFQGELVEFALEQEPIVQGALFSMDVRSGHVLAMVGGYSFEESEFNRAVQAMRQVGSAFKPVIYASALEKGFTPASIIVDSPIVFRSTEDDTSWKPSNYEEKFYGDTTFRQALIKSRNIPTVKIVQDVQVPYLINFAKRLGMNAQFNPDLSIALGSATTTLMELTRMYALFPRLGRKVSPIFLSKVENRDGVILEEKAPDVVPVMPPPIPALSSAESSSDAPLEGESEGDGKGKGEGSEEDEDKETELLQSQAQAAPPESYQKAEGRLKRIVLPTYPAPEDPAQVVDPRVAYVMTHLMTEVVDYGTGHAAKSLGRPAAGKTGTTNDSIDAWFMGFTPDIVTGVWVGFDNQKSLGQGETGARAALPIWLNYMQDAVKTLPTSDFVVPPGIVFAPIDPHSGKRLSANSSSSISEAFIEGTEPEEVSVRNVGRAETASEFFKEDRE